MEKKEEHFCEIIYVLLQTAGLPAYILYAETAGKELYASEILQKYYFLPVFCYLVAVVIFWLINQVRAIRADTSHENLKVLNSMLILKYGMVVYFIVNYITWVFLFFFISGAMVIATRGLGVLMLPFVIAFVPAVVLLAFLSMLPGSMYGIKVAEMTRNCGRTDNGSTIIHGFLQFLFVLDVLDAMYLSVIKWKRGKKSAAIILCLYVLLIILIIIFGGIVISGIIKLFR